MNEATMKRAEARLEDRRGRRRRLGRTARADPVAAPRHGARGHRGSRSRPYRRARRGTSTRRRSPTSTRCSSRRAPTSSRCAFPTRRTSSRRCTSSKRGVPLLVEKPLVFDLAEADALLAEAERQGVFFAINLNHRYAEPVQARQGRDRRGRARRHRLRHVALRWRAELWRRAPTRTSSRRRCTVSTCSSTCAAPSVSVAAQMTDMTRPGTYTTLAVALRVRIGGGGLARRVVRLVICLPRHPDDRGQRHRGQTAHRGHRQAADRCRRRGTRLGECGRPATSTTRPAPSSTPSTGTWRRCWRRSGRASSRRSTPGRARRALELAMGIIRSFEEGVRVAV